MPEGRIETSGAATVRPGVFVAVVGPSGAGKDTLLRIAAERLADDPSFRFARRVVTREGDPAIEDHETIGEEAFGEAEAAGAFCLSWRAHGLCYGLPAPLDLELRRGVTIVANVSRHAVAAAAERFPSLAVVEIAAPKEVRLERIAARGREDRMAIERRLARGAPLAPQPLSRRYRRIDNVGAPEAAAEALAGFLRELARQEPG